MSEESDRLIIKTMRLAVWGLGGILVFFVLYIVVTLLVASRENRRIDELERRIERLEMPAEKP